MESAKEEERGEIVYSLKKTDLIYEIEDRPPFKEAVFVAIQTC